MSANTSSKHAVSSVLAFEKPVPAPGADELLPAWVTEHTDPDFSDPIGERDDELAELAGLA
jgi:hypothetical protein